MALSSISRGSPDRNQSTDRQGTEEFPRPVSGTWAARRPLPSQADSIQGFIDEYAQATMTSGGTRSLADLWAFPSFVVGAGVSRVVQSREEIEEFFSGARAQYSAHGIVDTQSQVEDIDWVSQGLVVVKIRWLYFDATGKKLGDERSSYTLERDAFGQFKLRVVLIRGSENKSPEALSGV